MQDSAFQSNGQNTYVFDSTAWVKITTNGNTSCSSYRVQNLTGTTPYFSYSPVITNAAGQDVTPVTTVTAPVAGTPQVNTIGMPALGVGIFGLPVPCWVRALATTTFAITPGEGM